MDRDFFHVTIEPRHVAFSDYFPRSSAPNEYIILDFDKEGRVVGYALEGLLAEWAGESLKNRAKLLWARTVVNAASLSLASKVVSELGKRAIFDAFPKIDDSGHLPAYS
ncbi:hypothetical protein EPN44_11135 [bacterium]|nr:MAG: hypothetical protein EPN44_11135 [bacterium]